MSAAPLVRHPSFARSLMASWWTMCWGRPAPQDGRVSAPSCFFVVRFAAYSGVRPRPEPMGNWQVAAARRVEISIFQRDTTRPMRLWWGGRPYRAAIRRRLLRGRVQVVLGHAADGRCCSHFPFLLAIVISCAGVTSVGSPPRPHPLLAGRAGP
jgi:hypothetical protein